MSFQKETYLMCDGDGCEARFGLDNMSHGYTAKNLRRDAQSEGWKFRNGKDLCPDCAPQEGKVKG